MVDPDDSPLLCALVRLFFLKKPRLLAWLLLASLSFVTWEYSGGVSSGIEPEVGGTKVSVDSSRPISSLVSMSSASRYHFRRRVYLPQPS